MTQEEIYAIFDDICDQLGDFNENLTRTVLKEIIETQMKIENAEMTIEVLTNSIKDLKNDVAKLKRKIS